MRCDHPHLEEAEIRRFKFARGSYFSLQCPDCGSATGQHLDPLELGVHPKTIKRAAPKPSKGRGNSKRRNFEARFKRPDWKKLRGIVLDRDDYTCRNCGEPANQVHHLTYERFEAERLTDLAASCADCNMAERQMRVAGGE